MNDPEVVEILLVEDNPQDAALTIRALKKNGLANGIFHVKDGAEALDFIFTEGQYESRATPPHPRVILLDLKLPKVDGLEVLRRIKLDERTRAIPVVIVTSSREDPDIKAAYQLGVNSYVVKPVSFDAFVDAVSKLGLYWMLVNQPAALR